MLTALVFAAAVAAPAPPAPSAPPCQKPLLSLTQSAAEAAATAAPCNDGSSVRLWRMSAADDPGMVRPRSPDNFYRQPARCGAVGEAVARQVRTAAAGRMTAQYAVMREVDGCPVPAPVGYRQDYLAPSKADARPAGAPPRRR